MVLGLALIAQIGIRIRQAFFPESFVLQVSAEVRNRLQDRAKDFFIYLDDVSIVSKTMHVYRNQSSSPNARRGCDEEFKIKK